MSNYPTSCVVSITLAQLLDHPNSLSATNSLFLSSATDSYWLLGNSLAICLPPHLSKSLDQPAALNTRSRFLFFPRLSASVLVPFIAPLTKGEANHYIDNLLITQLDQHTGSWLNTYTINLINLGVPAFVGGYEIAGSVLLFNVTNIHAKMTSITLA